MTMTVEERKVLTVWANKNVAVGTILYPVVILARVALKEDAIRTAQSAPFPMTTDPEAFDD